MYIPRNLYNINVVTFHPIITRLWMLIRVSGKTIRYILPVTKINII